MKPALNDFREIAGLVMALFLVASCYELHTRDAIIINCRRGNHLCISDSTMIGRVNRCLWCLSTTAYVVVFIYGRSVTSQEPWYSRSWLGFIRLPQRRYQTAT